MTAAQPEAFGAALAGEPVRLIGADGRTLPAAVRRWHGTAGEEDGWLLDRCGGPTVDLGCGPGRLVAALLGRGSVLVEAEPPGAGLWQGPAQLQREHTSAGRGPWFPWAVVGLDALGSLAEQAGLWVEGHHRGRRCFAELRCPSALGWPA